MGIFLPLARVIEFCQWMDSIEAEQERESEKKWS